MNVYVYPWSTKSNAAAANPYLRDFIQSLTPHCRVVNLDRPSAYGLFGVVPWLRSLDVLVLHWAGNLPDKRGGAAQIAFLRGLLRARSRLGLRIAYVLHNKVSHTATRRVAKERVERLVLTHADLVVTHAREGVAFAMANGATSRERIHHLPHPMDAPAGFVAGVEPFERRPHDVLVWGRAEGYKGIDALVSVLEAQGLQRRYRILVAGRFADAAGFEALRRRAPFITFDNRFIPDAELRTLMSESKAILLPYRTESLLSSSALMRSLATDAVVIGPDAGAFHDCAELGLSATYREPSEWPAVLDRALASDRVEMLQRRRAFAAQFPWEEFGRAFSALIGG